MLIEYQVLWTQIFKWLHQVSAAFGDHKSIFSLSWSELFLENIFKNYLPPQVKILPTTAGSDWLAKRVSELILSSWVINRSNSLLIHCSFQRTFMKKILVTATDLTYPKPSLTTFSRYWLKIFSNLFEIDCVISILR